MAGEKREEGQKSAVVRQAQRERSKYTGPLTRRSLLENTCKSYIVFQLLALCVCTVCAHTCHVIILAAQDELIENKKHKRNWKCKWLCVRASVCVYRGRVKLIVPSTRSGSQDKSQNEFTSATQNTPLSVHLWVTGLSAVGSRGGSMCITLPCLIINVYYMVLYEVLTCVLYCLHNHNSCCTTYSVLDFTNSSL